MSEQSSYINYFGFNPFPSSGHLNHEKDDGSRGSAKQHPSKCLYHLCWEMAEVELGVHG